MPNITITVDDRLYRAARIHAAFHSTTVTEILRAYLLRIVTECGEYSASDEILRDIQNQRPEIFRAYNTYTPSPSFHSHCETVKSLEEEEAPPPPSFHWHCETVRRPHCSAHNPSNQIK